MRHRDYHADYDLETRRNISGVYMGQSRLTKSVTTGLDLLLT